MNSFKSRLSWLAVAVRQFCFSAALSESMSLPTRQDLTFGPKIDSQWTVPRPILKFQAVLLMTEAKSKGESHQLSFLRLLSATKTVLSLWVCEPGTMDLQWLCSDGSFLPFFVKIWAPRESQRSPPRNANGSSYDIPAVQWPWCISKVSMWTT